MRTSVRADLMVASSMPVKQRLNVSSFDQKSASMLFTFDQIKNFIFMFLYIELRSVMALHRWQMFGADAWWSMADAD